MSAGRPWVIYALADPQSGSVRYVGFTSQQPPERRYQAHLKETITKRTHAGCWIKSLLNVGLVPSFHILERGAGPGWEDAEKRWITRFGGSGSRHLTNHRAGGQGNLLEGEAGEVVRERLRQAGKEHMSDPANRERLCEFNMKRMADPAARRRLSELNKERLSDPAARERISECTKKQMADPAARERARKCGRERMRTLWANPQYRKQHSTGARQLMRELYAKHGDGGREQILAEFEQAGLRGEILRASNTANQSWRLYARFLLGGGKRRGWIYTPSSEEEFRVVN